ncbi:hypothetical protein AVO42_06595 [Thiomicrospira sp. XS5]|uniref:hypothetical protein n=1 Tax=Thiomicrospira sp. XS5 TaxID=1775636 RepID=UPI000748BB57|nr:hypothetical protein [Thiomicrospira sp. XS5]KUJ75023.1 hypothetical protein AVO42_06595 [Thiomicrospira sp. XS5]
MNSELKQLYESKWNNLLNGALSLKVDAANPLLIKVDEDYINSDIKIMIVGQETDGWHGQLKSSSHNVDSLMNGYYDYFHKKTKNGKERGKRAFWNFKNFSYFEHELTKHFKDKSVSFLWNNISKIGNNGRGKPHKSIRSLERTHFNIVKEEFRILKPDIVIFTTGSSRDPYIRHHFGEGVKFIPKLQLEGGKLANETLNLLAEVIVPDFSSMLAVRIEHPNRRTLSNKVTLHLIKELVKNKT